MAFDNILIMWQQKAYSIQMFQILIVLIPEKFFAYTPMHCIVE